jgi:hypothetical protein
VDIVQRRVFSADPLSSCPPASVFARSRAVLRVVPPIRRTAGSFAGTAGRRDAMKHRVVLFVIGLLFLGATPVWASPTVVNETGWAYHVEGTNDTYDESTETSSSLAVYGRQPQRGEGWIEVYGFTSRPAWCEGDGDWGFEYTELIGSGPGTVTVEPNYRGATASSDEVQVSESTWVVCPGDEEPEDDRDSGPITTTTVELLLTGTGPVFRDRTGSRVHVPTVMHETVRTTYTGREAVGEIVLDGDRLPASSGTIQRAQWSNHLVTW